MASHLKNSPRTVTDEDSLNLVQEKTPVTKAQITKEQKFKDQLYETYVQNNGDGFGGGQGSFNQRNPSESKGLEVNKPKVFVTNEMVNVSRNCCLKCDSPNHKFRNVLRCVYGQSELMAEPCQVCQRGGHQPEMCIKNKDPISEETNSQNGDSRDLKDDEYPDQTQNMMENQGRVPRNPNNEWVSSLFN